MPHALINWLRQRDLMLPHGIGVQAETAVRLHQVDEDFCASL